MDVARYADTPFGSVRRTGGRHGYLAYFPQPIPRQFPLSPAAFAATLFCVERVTSPVAAGSRSPGRVRTADADALSLTSDRGHYAP
jgi:hypothetical protein